MRLAGKILLAGVAAVSFAALRAGAQVLPGSAAQRLVRFDVTTIAGEQLRVGPHEPATLIAVFATWCRSCADEVALINDVARELSSHGVRVIALNVDKDGEEPVRKWLDARGSTYAAALDAGGTIARVLGVVGVPEIHLISGDGRVVFSRRGPLESGLPSLRRAIAALKTGTQ